MPYSNLSEKELLKRLREDDEQAFTEIYNRFWEKLAAIGYYYTRDKPAAEDIVHDVMMSLWLRRATVEILSLQAYLGTAAKFAVFKSISREKKRKEIISGKLLNENVNLVEENLDAKFLEAYLKGAVESLPEKARLVFRFSREEQLSIKEIATKIDLSPKAVEYHLTRALRFLKKGLKK